MCTITDVLYTIIAVVMVWCSVMVNAAAFIRSGCRYENSMAGFHDMAVETGGWDTVCEYMAKYTLQMGTIILSLSHKLTNQKQPMHVQYVIKNHGKMFDGKLLSKYKMTLMAKYPLPTSICNINISCNMSKCFDYLTMS